MKEEKFNLRERRIENLETDKFSKEGIYLGENVKEFIKRETSLLSDLFEGKITWAEFDEKRAELAGKDLI